MTPEQIKNLLPIIEALVEGKAVQFRPRNTILPWEDVIVVTGFYDDYEYRIKPEPRRFWLIENCTGPGSVQFESKTDAALNCKFGSIGIVEFVEVIK